MTKLPFEAIIFDHDGTLIDTERADLEACQRLYQECGAEISIEYWAEHIVGHMDGYELILTELIQKNGHGATRDSLWQRLRELWSIALENIELMPGVTNLVPSLHAAGYPLAVATASDRAWARRWLTHFNLWPYFQVIATSDDVVNNKPAPDVYLFAAAQLGVEPAHCLVFEDSLAGLRAAKAAGMTVVAVPSPLTQTLDFSQADGLVAGLDKVTNEWVHTFNLQRSPFDL
jgi:HAD superfamily hydrolase (TIGR01509 family)